VETCAARRDAEHHARPKESFGDDDFPVTNTVSSTVDGDRPADTGRSVAPVRVEESLFVAGTYESDFRGLVRIVPRPLIVTAVDETCIVEPGRYDTADSRRFHYRVTAGWFRRITIFVYDYHVLVSTYSLVSVLFSPASVLLIDSSSTTDSVLNVGLHNLFKQLHFPQYLYVAAYCQDVLFKIDY